MDRLLLHCTENSIRGEICYKPNEKTRMNWVNWKKGAHHTWNVLRGEWEKSTYNQLVVNSSIDGYWFIRTSNKINNFVIAEPLFWKAQFFYVLVDHSIGMWMTERERASEWHEKNIAVFVSHTRNTWIIFSISRNALTHTHYYYIQCLINHGAESSPYALYLRFDSSILKWNFNVIRIETATIERTSRIRLEDSMEYLE